MSNVIRDVRFGARKVKMVSIDNGISFKGDGGAEGLILTAHLDNRGYVMRIEDRLAGNSWASRKPSRNLDVCAANLRRDLLRLAGVVAMKGGE